MYALRTSNLLLNFRLQTFHFQGLYLLGSEFPPFTRFESPVSERPEFGSLQVLYGVPDGFAHAPDLPVAPFANSQPQQTVPVATAVVQENDISGQRSMSIERNSVPQPFDGFAIGHAGDARFIGTRDTVARVRESRRQLAIIGQQQQAFRVVVEASDRVDVVAHSRQKIQNGPPPLGIGSRRDVAGCFVQEDVARLRDALDSPPVDANLVFPGIDLDPHRQDRLAVDSHASVGNELLRRAAGRDASLGKSLLKANAF